MTDRDLDLIIFGASGYTGQLVADYIQKAYGQSQLRWALAGRNQAKLETVRGQIGASTNLPLILADITDEGSLRKMAGRAKVIITTVGPYQLYGTGLVAACAAHGTDYVDLCGEPAWMHDTVRQFQSAAENSGARIVHSCGFDSIPFDLGVYFAQEAAYARWGKMCENMRGRVRKMQGTFSGGTAASFMASMARAAREPEVLGWLTDPFTLVPGFEGPAQPPANRPHFDADLDCWAAPFIMAPINRKNIHRSNALMGFPYGTDFTYDEMMMAGPGDMGKKMAETITAGNKKFGDNAPKPGEGPSKQERENGFYDVLFVGDGGSGQQIMASVSGDMDPGYGSTSKMLSEAALCLLYDMDRKACTGGIYTPAAAMGNSLIKRLKKNAGLKFTLERQTG